MKVIVIVPWRSKGCRHREAAWRRVRREWGGWDVVTADDDGEPFSRAASLNLAAIEHPADVYVIADADTLVDGRQVAEAVALAGAEPGIVLAYSTFRYLSRRGTKAVLGGYRGPWEPLTEWSLDWTVSSCLAVSAATWAAVGGFDDRFRAWGGEDVAFVHACETLAGPTRRILGSVWHCWHPSEPERPVANFDLLGRYRDALGDPVAMRRLIEERHQ